MIKIITLDVLIKMGFRPIKNSGEVRKGVPREMQWYRGNKGGSSYCHAEYLGEINKRPIYTRKTEIESSPFRRDSEKGPISQEDLEIGYDGIWGVMGDEDEEASPTSYVNGTSNSNDEEDFFGLMVEY